MPIPVVWLRHLPVSWRSPESLLELPAKIADLLLRFGPLRAIPEIVPGTETTGPFLTVGAAFLNIEAAFAAANALNGFDWRVSEELQASGGREPELWERLWVEVASIGPDVETADPLSCTIGAAMNNNFQSAQYPMSTLECLAHSSVLVAAPTDVSAASDTLYNDTIEVKHNVQPASLGVSPPNSIASACLGFSSPSVNIHLGMKNDESSASFSDSTMDPIVDAGNCDTDGRGALLAMMDAWLGSTASQNVMAENMQTNMPISMNPSPEPVLGTFGFSACASQLQPQLALSPRREVVSVPNCEEVTPLSHVNVANTGLETAQGEHAPKCSLADSYFPSSTSNNGNGMSDTEASTEPPSPVFCLDTTSQLTSLRSEESAAVMPAEVAPAAVDEEPTPHDPDANLLDHAPASQVEVLPNSQFHNDISPTPSAVAAGAAAALAFLREGDGDELELELAAEAERQRLESLKEEQQVLWHAKEAELLANTGLCSDDQRRRLESAAVTLVNPTLSKQRRRMLTTLLEAERRRQEPLARQREVLTMCRCDSEGMTFRWEMREAERLRRQYELEALTAERGAMEIADVESRLAEDTRTAMAQRILQLELASEAAQRKEMAKADLESRMFEEAVAQALERHRERQERRSMTDAERWQRRALEWAHQREASERCSMAADEKWRRRLDVELLRLGEEEKKKQLEVLAWRQKRALKQHREAIEWDSDEMEKPDDNDGSECEVDASTSGRRVASSCIGRTERTSKVSAKASELPLSKQIRTNPIARPPLILDDVLADKNSTYRQGSSKSDIQGTASRNGKRVDKDPSEDVVKNKRAKTRNAMGMSCPHDNQDHKESDKTNEVDCGKKQGEHESTIVLKRPKNCFGSTSLEPLVANEEAKETRKSWSGMAQRMTKATSAPSSTLAPPSTVTSRKPRNSLFSDVTKVNKEEGDALKAKLDETKKNSLVTIEQQRKDEEELAPSLQAGEAVEELHQKKDEDVRQRKEEELERYRQKAAARRKREEDEVDQVTVFEEQQLRKKSIVELRRQQEAEERQREVEERERQRQEIEQRKQEEWERKRMKVEEKIRWHFEPAERKVDEERRKLEIMKLQMLQQKEARRRNEEELAAKNVAQMVERQRQLEAIRVAAEKEAQALREEVAKRSGGKHSRVPPKLERQDMKKDAYTLLKEKAARRRKRKVSSSSGSSSRSSSRASGRWVKSRSERGSGEGALTWQVRMNCNSKGDVVADSHVGGPQMHIGGIECSSDNCRNPRPPNDRDASMSGSIINNPDGSLERRSVGHGSGSQGRSDIEYSARQSVNARTSAHDNRRQRRHSHNRESCRSRSQSVGQTNGGSRSGEGQAVDDHSSRSITSIGLKGRRGDSRGPNARSHDKRGHRYRCSSDCRRSPSGRSVVRCDGRARGCGRSRDDYHERSRVEREESRQSGHRRRH